MSPDKHCLTLPCWIPDDILIEGFSERNESSGGLLRSPFGGIGGRKETGRSLVEMVEEEQEEDVGQHGELKDKTFEEREKQIEDTF